MQKNKNAGGPKQYQCSAGFIVFGAAVIVVGYASVFIYASWHEIAGTPKSQNTGSVSLPSEFKLAPPAENMTFAAFLEPVKRFAIRNGVDQSLAERAFANIELDPDIIGFTTSQPEHNRPPWDYVDMMVSQKRIADGRSMLSKHAAILQKIEAAFGVDRHILIAIWGIESSYGSGQGTRWIIRSLATLAYQDQRRSVFWQEQLIAALKILANGDITFENMTGSWAGAMGHTQFMPTTYLAHAVDFDGDGRRDIWQSTTDALASTAAYLKVSKWKAGLVWGHEVRLPEGFDYSLSAPGNGKSVEDWLQLGIGVVEKRLQAAGNSKLELLLPAGNRGPAFLVSANFKSILRYNHSNLYALSVGLLADRLANGPELAGAWPRDLKLLQKQQRLELQRLLTKRGLDTGGIDGILGARSQSAIRSYQSAQNLPADGFASSDLLDRLRGAAEPDKTGQQDKADIIKN